MRACVAVAVAVYLHEKSITINEYKEKYTIHHAVCMSVQCDFCDEICLKNTRAICSCIQYADRTQKTDYVRLML